MNRHERAAQRHCPGPDHRPEAPMKTPATAACNRRVTGVQPRATAKSRRRGPPDNPSIGLSGPRWSTRVTDRATGWTLPGLGDPR